MMYNITVNVNLKDRSARDKLFEAIRAKQPLMVPGHSTLSRHTCNHDVLPYQPCTEKEEIIVSPSISPQIK